MSEEARRRRCWYRSAIALCGYGCALLGQTQQEQPRACCNAAQLLAEVALKSLEFRFQTYGIEPW